MRNPDWIMEMANECRVGIKFGDLWRQLCRVGAFLYSDVLHCPQPLLTHSPLTTRTVSPPIALPRVLIKDRTFSFIGCRGPRLCVILPIPI
ncbi:hypothetical protein VNO78_17491 [Psophocarpus tetragonolobus]|uniref:Uncharacterized protein n=1 Tax=Psophocarpus tetragonolobus TaxID=3891 RepID=A0AAN9SJI2_PSOTE